MQEKQKAEKAKGGKIIKKLLNPCENDPVPKSSSIVRSLKPNGDHQKTLNPKRPH
jgi:hypothetical protein